MTTNRCIPLARLYIFPLWPTLKIHFALGIEHMQMHDGVQQLRAAMTLAPCGRANYFSAFVYYREYFILVIHIII